MSAPRDFRRSIVETRRDPMDRQRHLMLLDCGHTVSRRANSTKRMALCGHCQRILEDPAFVNEAWNAAIDDNYPRAAA